MLMENPVQKMQKCRIAPQCPCKERAGLQKRTCLFGLEVTKGLEPAHLLEADEEREAVGDRQARIGQLGQVPGV